MASVFETYVSLSKLLIGQFIVEGMQYLERQSFFPLSHDGVESKFQLSALLTQNFTLTIEA